MKYFIAAALVSVPLIAISASPPPPRAMPVDQLLFLQSGHATPEATSLGSGITNCPDMAGPNPNRCQIASKIVAEGESDHWGIRFHTVNTIGPHGNVSGPKGSIPATFDIFFNIENHEFPIVGDATYGTGMPGDDYGLLTRMPGAAPIQITPAANGDFSVTIPVGLEGFGLLLRTYENTASDPQTFENIRIRITGASLPVGCPTPQPGWNDRIRWIIEEQ